MATAYEFTGDQEMEYPAWGLRVSPGDVVRLDGRPPSDGKFREVTEDAEPTAVAATEPPEGSGPGDDNGTGGLGRGGEGTEPPVETPKQPNLAASAAEWTAYAKAMGVPAEIADNASRKAIIEHFTKPDGPFLEGVEPPKPADEGDGDPKQPGADGDSTQQINTEGQ
jgi:hypothetical protein